MSWLDDFEDLRTWDPSPPRPDKRPKRTPAEAEKDRRAARKALGLCSRCGAKVFKGGVCQTHYTDLCERKARNRAKGRT